MTKPALIKPELQEDEDASKEGDKTEPRFPDDDGGDDVIEADFYPSDDKPLCTWSGDPEEHRRVFVFDRMNSADIDGKMLVQNMELVNQWLKSGSLPEKERKLKAVKE